MNKQNIKHWEKDGKLYSEWADRALDDDDRYTPDGIVITVDIVIADFASKVVAEGKLYNKMWAAYDQWIKETRG
jgi:hypothetical protein